jgi:hypothetical protein
MMTMGAVDRETASSKRGRATRGERGAANAKFKRYESS